MARVNSVVVDQLLAGQLDLLRLEAHARTEAVKLLIQMEAELRRELAVGGLTDFGRRRTAALLRQTDAVVTDYFGRIEGAMDRVLGGAAQAAQAATADALDQVLAVASLEAGVPTLTAMRAVVDRLLIFGAPSADWWAKQAEDVKFRFASAVQQGMAQGETTGDIVGRVRDFMDVTKRNAEALVRTSVMEVAAGARDAVYQANSDIVEGTRQVSTLDSATTDICIAYDGAEYDLDGEPLEGTDLPYDGGVPRHWGCRSVEVPITKTFKELGIDIPEPTGGERASADGPVPANTNFDDFLTRMGAAFQDETLGPGRAELWRDGDLTLQQLLDLKGNPLTLSELEAKYA